MSTDASYRYERGVDPSAMEQAVGRCVEIILATAGGAVAGPALDVHARAVDPIRLSLRPARVEHVLGVPFERSQIAELIEPLGFTVGDPTDSDSVEVEVPDCRRYDVKREIDLIEEIARTHGYDNFPEQLAPFRPTVVPDHPLFALEESLRRLLIHRGAFELQTPSFVATGHIELPNPVSAAESHLRANMIRGVLRSVSYNLARGTRDVRMFEIGTVFFPPRAGDDKPVEETHLAVALVGRSAEPHWSGTGSKAVDLWDAKGLFEAIVKQAWPAAVVAPVEGERGVDWLSPQTPALEARVGDRRVAIVGQVDADAIDTPPWAGAVFGMEVDLPATPDEPATPVYTPVPQFPAIERDLALLVPAGVTAAQVEAAIEAKAGALVERIELFDLYEGEGIAADARSLGYRLTFRSAERTLADTDVEPAVRRVLKRLQEELNVRQRG